MNNSYVGIPQEFDKKSILFCIESIDLNLVLHIYYRPYKYIFNK